MASKLAHLYAEARDRVALAWDAVRGLARAAPPGYGSTGQQTGGPYYSDAFGTKRALTPYELIEKYKSIIYFCTNLNASRVAAIPLRLYAMSGAGPGMAKPRRSCGPVPVRRSAQARLRNLSYVRRSIAAASEIDEVTDHPFLTLLDNSDPEGYFDRMQLIDMMVRYIDVVGTSYHKPVEDGLFPSELWPLQSQFVWPVRRSSSAMIDRYTYFAESYPFAELLRVRLRPSLHDPYGCGYAGAQAAASYGGLEDQWVSIQESVLTAGPRYGMVISAANPLMPLGADEAAKLEKNLNAKFSRGGAARVWVQRQSLKTDIMTYPPSDLAGLTISEYTLERICNCLDCPPTIFSRDANIANITAAKELHASGAVEPRCNVIAAGFTRLVRKYDPRLFCAFDPAVKEDEESRAKVFDIKLKNGSMTYNDVNDEEGRPRVTYGDEPWISSTLRQPSEERPEPAAGFGAGAKLPGKGAGKDGADKTLADDAAGDPKRSAFYDRAETILRTLEDGLKRESDGDPRRDGSLLAPVPALPVPEPAA